jgi:hypothetical protein
MLYSRKKSLASTGNQTVAFQPFALSAECSWIFPEIRTCFNDLCNTAMYTIIKIQFLEIKEKPYFYHGVTIVFGQNDQWDVRCRRLRIAGAGHRAAD